MILHITEVLSLDSPGFTGIVEKFDTVKSLLDSYSIKHNLITNDTEFSFKIYPQKITLDEFAMNNLFFNVISPYFYANIGYMPLGGNGCEFSISLSHVSNFLL